MAYILGFFTADGNMINNKRGAHFINFEITDKNLLEKIRGVLGSNHKIAVLQRNGKWKTSYRLQIGSKTMFNDLLKLGLTPNKSKTIDLPKIPNRYFPHFARGYFDGDGNVVFGYFRKAGRKNKSEVLLTRFTSGSQPILENLQSKLKRAIGIGGSLYITHGFWQLSYSKNDSLKLFHFMYPNKEVRKLIYLKRKYKIYRRAVVA